MSRWFRTKVLFRDTTKKQFSSINLFRRSSRAPREFLSNHLVTKNMISSSSYLFSRLSRLHYTTLDNSIGQQQMSSHLNSFSSFCQQNFSTWRRKQKAKKSPYDILNVPKTATDKEIKVAYFKEAKKYHPDLNPNDPKAKEKFQEIAAAYELLSDPQKRRIYDQTGDTQQQYTQYNNPYSNYDAAKHAEDVFRSVQEDIDVVKEALESYFEVFSNCTLFVAFVVNEFSHFTG